jgi:enoyl-CoA hydratase/carnithine racemase
MAQPGLLLRRDGGMATVIISNPAERNAMTLAMWRELPALLHRLAADPAVRVLVLTGDGDTFCSGADIAGLAASDAHEDQDRDTSVNGNKTLAAAVAAEEALAAFPKPALAAVRGYCVGGGCQLAAACDLRYAALDARFGVTPARLGIVYPASSTRRLVGLVGPATARYLLYSAELIDAERALRTGLVDELLDDGPEFDARVADFARALAERSQLTQRAAKEFTTAALDGTAPDPARLAYWAQQARESAERAEGVAAFLERRAPRFTWTPRREGSTRC